DLGEAGLATPGDHHVRPGRAEGPGDGRADASATTGDQRGTALEGPRHPPDSTSRRTGPVPGRRETRRRGADPVIRRRAYEAASGDRASTIGGGASTGGGGAASGFGGGGASIWFSSGTRASGASSLEHAATPMAATTRNPAKQARMKVFFIVSPLIGRAVTRRPPFSAQSTPKDHVIVNNPSTCAARICT